MNKRLMTILVASGVLCSSVSAVLANDAKKTFSLGITDPSQIYTFDKRSEHKGTISDGGILITFFQEPYGSSVVILDKKDSTQPTGYCSYYMTLWTLDPHSPADLPQSAPAENPDSDCGMVRFTYDPEIYKPGGLGNTVAVINKIKQTPTI